MPRSADVELECQRVTLMRAAGDGAAGAPNLDTEGSSLDSLPSRAALYRPVRLSERQYRHRVAEHFHRFADELSTGPVQRSLRRRAQAIAGCGEQVVALACADCGAVDGHSGRILVSCSLRVCPACARLRADELRTKMDELIPRLPKHPGYAFYLFTFTTRFDPADPEHLTVSAIRERAQRLRKACGYVWRRMLKHDGSAMLLAFEVSPSGEVHAHALYYGPRQDIRVVRALYLDKIPDSPFVNVKQVKKPKKAVREVAKYVVKAASPKRAGHSLDSRGEYLDPELAAKVDIALRGARLYDFFGAWRGVRIEPQEEHEHDAVLYAEHCDGCGAHRPLWRTIVLPRSRWREHAARDWQPRLTRTGSDPPLRVPAERLTHSPEPANDVLDRLALSPRWRQRFRQWQAAAADAQQRARIAVGFTGGHVS